MGKQLSIGDLNSLLDAEEAREAPKTTGRKAPSKDALNASSASSSRPKSAASRKEKAQTPDELIASKPSAFQAEHRQRLRRKKVLSFGQVPEFVAEGFERLAAEAGMTKRAYLYQLLREKGVDIPSQDLMDGRRL